VEAVYTDPVRLAGVEHPRSEVVPVLERSRCAFSDQHYTVQDRVDGNDRVALGLTWSGTHAGRCGPPLPAGAWVGLGRRELLHQLGIERVRR